MKRFAVPLVALVLAGIPALAGADALRPPDGTYHYELRHGGTVAGTSTLVFHTDAGTLSVVDETQLTIFTLKAHATASYATSDLHLTGYAADVTLPTAVQHTDVVPSPGHMKVSVGAQQVDIAADASAPLEILSDNFGGTTMMIPAEMLAANATRATFAVLSGGLAVVASVASGTPPARPDGIPARDNALAVNAGPLELIFWYDPATVVVDAVVIPAQGAEFRRVDH